MKLAHNFYLVIPFDSQGGGKYLSVFCSRITLNMYEVFFQSLRNKVAFDDDELAAIRTYMTPKKIRKKQYLLQEGDICKYQAFVTKGMLRSYTVDEKGNQSVLQFAPEGWWIADLSS